MKYNPLRWFRSDPPASYDGPLYCAYKHCQKQLEDIPDADPFLRVNDAAYNSWPCLRLDLNPKLRPPDANVPTSYDIEHITLSDAQTLAAQGALERSILADR